MRHCVCYVSDVPLNGLFGSFTSIHLLEPSINYHHIKMPHTTLWERLVKRQGKTKKHIYTHNKWHFQRGGIYFYTLTCVFTTDSKVFTFPAPTVLLVLYERGCCCLSAGGAVKAFRVKALLNRDWFFH